jgi:leucyl-tRNA synthetase
MFGSAVLQSAYSVLWSLAALVAINGKVRGSILVDSQKIDDKEMVLKMAKENNEVIKWIGDKKIVKEIYIPGKMVNLVIQ